MLPGADPRGPGPRARPNRLADRRAGTVPVSLECPDQQPARPPSGLVQRIRKRYPVLPLQRRDAGDGASPTSRREQVQSRFREGLSALERHPCSSPTRRCWSTCSSALRINRFSSNPAADCAGSCSTRPIPTSAPRPPRWPCFSGVSCTASMWIRRTYALSPPRQRLAAPTLRMICSAFLRTCQVRP